MRGLNKRVNLLIDYILMSKENWRSVKNVKVIRRAEVGSDHYLVRMEVMEQVRDKDIKRRRRVNQL